MTANLILHCGGIPATREQIQAIPLPFKTDTYEPVSHIEIMDTAHEIFEDAFHLAVRSERYGIVKDGARMFGVLEFEPQDTADWSICLGIRNSYDKSMSAGIAVGSIVTVCDNLCFSGDSVTFMRKHTKNVHDDLISLLQSASTRALEQHQILSNELTSFKQIEVLTDQGYALVGYMLGNEFITPRQASRAIEYWQQPPHQEHEERTLFSWYNALNNALKRTLPDTVMERHFSLHRTAQQFAKQGLSLLGVK